eukprot:c4502_g1_i1.p1 GENE.c4502_g1_i1~~c4502_g1_i1.p1  ORF type:complete len:250 (-),score=64.59 c4502_g1_i1:205-861(-)
MTDRFDSTDEMYTNLSERIARNIQSLPAKPWDEKQTLEQVIKSDITEAEALVQQMEIEVRSIPASHRQALSKRCQTYKQEVKTMSQDLKRAMFAVDDTESRRQLFESQGGPGAYDRSNMATSTERLKSSSDKIKHAQQVAIETEMRGGEVIEELHIQRSKILRAREGLDNINMAISKSGRIVGNMLRRSKTTQIMMYFIIVSLVIMISVIVYFKWIKK